MEFLTGIQTMRIRARALKPLIAAIFLIAGTSLSMMAQAGNGWSLSQGNISTDSNSPLRQSVFGSIKADGTDSEDVYSPQRVTLEVKNPATLRARGLDNRLDLDAAKHWATTTGSRNIIKSKLENANCPQSGSADLDEYLKSSSLNILLQGKNTNGHGMSAAKSSARSSEVINSLGCNSISSLNQDSMSSDLMNSNTMNSNLVDSSLSGTNSSASSSSASRRSSRRESTSAASSSKTPTVSLPKASTSEGSRTPSTFSSNAKESQRALPNRYGKHKSQRALIPEWGTPSAEWRGWDKWGGWQEKRKKDASHDAENGGGGSNYPTFNTDQGLDSDSGAFGGKGQSSKEDLGSPLTSPVKSDDADFNSIK